MTRQGEKTESTGGGEERRRRGKTDGLKGRQIKAEREKSVMERKAWGREVEVK